MTALASVAQDRPGPTLRAAALVAQSRFEDLPEQVVELAKQCILDTIGVTIAGAHEPVSKIVLEQALSDGGTPQATVIGRDCRLPLRAASLVNGTFGHALDYDDCNLSMNGHVSVVVLPAVLAAAEKVGASGRDVINAFVAGFETACRVGQTVAPAHYDRGFHATGTIGAFASAAGASRMMGFDMERTANAFGIAGTMAAALKGLFGTMCKPFHAGRAAENGLYAALLSAQGMQARPDVLECRQGFGAAFAPEFFPDGVESAPPRGADFHIRNNLFKYHAACYGTHGAIECGRLLAEQVKDPSQIRRLVLEVAVENDKTCNIQTPDKASEARFSLRHCVGMTIAGLDTGDAEAYGAHSLANSQVSALREKTEVVLVPGLDIAHSRLSADMADGTRVQVERDATIPETNLPLQRQRLLSKFDMLLIPVIGKDHALQVKDAILNLEQMEDIATLMRLCTRKGQ